MNESVPLRSGTTAKPSSTTRPSTTTPPLVSIESADDALRAIYLADYDRLVGLARWIVGSRAMAEELVQDTFVALLEKPPRLRRQEALPGYVQAAVVNRSRSRFRRLRLERKHAAASVEQAEGADDADDAVRTAVAALPRRQRECVVLRFYADLSVDAIADTLGISPGSVKTHLHRANNTLEDLLDGSDVR